MQVQANDQASQHLSTKSQNGYNNTAAKSTFKAENSNQFFKNTRVDSCTHVVVRNGVAEAVPFRPSPKKDPAPGLNSTSLSRYILLV